MTPRWAVKAAWFFFFALAAALALTGPALAAPKAQSAEECAAYADMALVAAAASRQGVEQTRLAALLPDVYAPLYELRGADAIVIARAIVATAAVWQRENPRAPPALFAQLLGQACMRGRGSMDAILGSDA